VRHSTFARIMNGTIENIGTYELPLVAKKKVVAAGMTGSSTEAFPIAAHCGGGQYPVPEGGGGVLEL
jgi:hypothetical protein